MAIRLYEFRVNGYVAGVPGEFAGGTQAFIDEDTGKVLARGPLGQPLSIPLEDEQPPPQEAEQQPVQQQPPVSDPLADALQKLGG